MIAFLQPKEDEAPKRSDCYFEEAYFEFCPECQQPTDDLAYLNVENRHFSVCRKHKVYWRLGRNLFCSWKYESEEVWRANAEFLAICMEVKPMFCECEATGLTCWVAQAIGAGCDVVLGIFGDMPAGREAAERLACRHKDDECVVNSGGNEQVCTRLVRVTDGTFAEAVMQWDREHASGYSIGTPFMGYSESEL